MDTLKVRDAKDVEQVVRAAIASEQPLEIIGHGSKRLVGQPMATNALLDLSALNAVTSYEPNELIITVQAGAPLADVLSLIDSKNQQFAFEPINTSMLLGTPDIGTIGGMIGAGLAGPRRIKAGGARDHLLGAHAVSGFGDSFKAGGRVVKNVTGYDLCKLLAGSWGTLAVMTEVTLKVMPRPESERTLVLRGLDDVAANRAMTAALGSPFDVSGAAHVPNSAFRSAGGGLGDLGSPAGGDVAAAGGHYGVGGPSRGRARLSSWRRSGRRRSWKMRPRRRSGVRFATFSRSRPMARLGAWPVWRIVCPPASGGALGQALGARYRRRRDLRLGRRPDLGGAAAQARRPGGAGARSASTPPAATPRCCARPRRYGAMSMCFIRKRAALPRLSERVRHSFDPKNILNRGRMMRGSAT